MLNKMFLTKPTKEDNNKTRELCRELPPLPEPEPELVLMRGHPHGQTQVRLPSQCSDAAAGSVSQASVMASLPLCVGGDRDRCCRRALAATLRQLDGVGAWACPVHPEA